eukprot:tig00001130_g7261.t1
MSRLLRRPLPLEQELGLLMRRRHPQRPALPRNPAGAMTSVERRVAHQPMARPLPWQQSLVAGADEKPAPSRNRHNIDDDGGDIPVIPDLEEEVEEDITRQVAAAPRVRNNRVQALKELDSEIKFSLPTTGDANIDLSILTSTLSPQDQVVEDEGPWEFDLLLSEVAQELQAEEDKKEEGLQPEEDKRKEP